MDRATRRGRLPERAPADDWAEGLHPVPLARGDAREARSRVAGGSGTAHRPRARDGRAGDHVLPPRRRPHRRDGGAATVARRRLRRGPAPDPRARLRDPAPGRPRARQPPARPSVAFTRRRGRERGAMRAARDGSPHQVRIGCSGWNYAHWRHGAFYPERLPAREWLRFYAQRFDTVELNNTFYRLPRRETVERWADETPPDFLFAVKVSRYLTHVVRLRDAAAHLVLLLERIDPLLGARKLGPLLWQLPPTFRRDDDRLAQALAELPRTLRHAFEFRHESWFAPEVLELLRSHGVALVIADRPEIRGFQTHELTADFTFVRFHHGTRGQRGNYSDSELDDWAGRIGAWSQRVDVYGYFNNDWEGFAPRNALGLKDRLGLESIDVAGAHPGRAHGHRS